MSSKLREADLEAIECVCTNMKMSSRVVGRAYDSALAPLGINVTQYAILINISRYEPISQMELAKHLEMERTTLYRAIAVLEKSGWVESVAERTGVAKTLALTAKGKRLVVKARDVWKEKHEAFLKTFGRERWNKLLQTLSKIRTHFTP